MKILTVPKFEHTLLASKGFKFDTSQLNIIRTVLGAGNNFEFINDDTCVRWTESTQDTHSDLGSDFFDMYLGRCIIEIDNANHYKWLDKNLEDFWQSVFGKSLDETGCAGIVSAHGDKCYQYKNKWLEAGIPFFYGVAIYFLTYTKEIGDIPKYESSQWVIDNYDKYVKKLNRIEPRDYVQPSDMNIELKDEMTVMVNPTVVKKYMDPTRGDQILELIEGKSIRLSKRIDNSSRVVDGKVMIKGIGVFDKKYFVEVAS